MPAADALFYVVIGLLVLLVICFLAIMKLWDKNLRQRDAIGLLCSDADAEVIACAEEILGARGSV